MDLSTQMGVALLAAGGLGAALGLVWHRRLARRAQAAQLAAVREDAMADLTQLRRDLEDSLAWHAQEITALRSAHDAARQARTADHQTELQQMQAAHEAHAQALLRRLASTELALDAERERFKQALLEARAEAGAQAASATQAREADVLSQCRALRAQVQALREQRRADTVAWMARIRASSETAATNDVQARARLTQALDDLRQRESALQEARAREAALSDQLRRFQQSSGVVLRAQLDSFQAREEAHLEQAEANETLARLRAQWLVAVDEKAQAQASQAALQSRWDERCLAHEAEQDDLREQLEASRRTAAYSVQLGEAREARLSVEIIELRAELDRLRRERADATRRLVGQHRPSRLALLDAKDVARLVRAAGAGRPPQAVALEGREPDDLTAIDGVDGPAEHWLQGLGILFYWQIAAWTAEEAAWIGQHLPGHGDAVWQRNWMAQCARLSAKEGLHVG